MKRILVALDGSDRAPLVLETAVVFTQRLGAQMRLFTAVEPAPVFPTELYALSSSELPTMQLDNAKKALLRLSRAVDPKLVHNIATDSGASSDAICTEARNYDADLIVIGSHGYRGLDRVLGTTAAKVVNRAGCPVLVARPKQYRQ